MGKMTDLNTRIIDLTVGELLEVIERKLQAFPLQGKEAEQREEKPRKYVHGRAGIAKLFQCSKTTASRIKQSGLIDGAYWQVGKTIVVDAEKALELASKRDKNLRKRIKS